MAITNVQKFTIKELNSMSVDELQVLDSILTVEQSADFRTTTSQQFENPLHSFEWVGENEYGNTFYYPVLPKFNRAGNFDSEHIGLQSDSMEKEKVPFGGIEWDGRDWTPEDFVAPVTDELYEESSLQLNIVSELVENNVHDDNSGNKNFGFVIGDYSPQFELDTSVPQEIKNTSKIKVNKKSGAF
tara:strand:- start:1932 stop:2489 length:558 start_codon:yes stop_codon:yes gene_type:complete